MRRINSKNLYRVLDANFNRTKEALRVCEDVSRFILDDTQLTRQLKTIRHQVTELTVKFNLGTLIGARDIDGDVGKATSRQELKRKKISDIFYANLQRSKESIRVLEEFAKLSGGQLAIKFKRLRYQLYALEKKAPSQF